MPQPSPKRRTAFCLTPDRAWFPAAICAAAHILAQPDAERLDIFIVCAPDDVDPGFGALPAELRGRIRVLTHDFAWLDSAAEGVRGVVLRRLFLDPALPPEYERIVTLDADMLVVRPGLAHLAQIDLAGAPLAAATDMIFLKQFGGGALAQTFAAYRAGLGLAADTPYFNAGLMVIDRAVLSREALGERALEYLSVHRDRCAFAEQSALNALLAGRFAGLSPRYNFMGDFFLLDLMQEIDPVVLHFISRPKPWEGPGGFGGERFAALYRAWFDASPWPDFGRSSATPDTSSSGADIPDRAAFRRRLLAYLARQKFADGPISDRPR